MSWIGWMFEAPAGKKSDFGWHWASFGVAVLGAVGFLLIINLVTHRNISGR